MKFSHLTSIQEKIIQSVDEAISGNTFIYSEGMEDLTLDKGFLIVPGDTPMTPASGHRPFCHAFQVTIVAFSTFEADQQTAQHVDKLLTDAANQIEEALTDFAFGETENYRALQMLNAPAIRTRQVPGNPFYKKVELIFEGEYYQE